MSGTLTALLTVVGMAETLLPEIAGLQPMVEKAISGNPLDNSEVENLNNMAQILNTMCEQKAAEIAARPDPQA